MLDYKLEELCIAPKVELHVHLEGSLTDIFWEEHNPVLARDIKKFRNAKSPSLISFLNCFRQIHRGLSSPYLYYLATIDFLSQLVEESIVYVEFTWAPGGFWRAFAGDFKLVYEAIAKGIDEFRNQLEAKILVDFVRSQPISFAEEIKSWLLKSKPKHIVGVNFGGDEANFRIDGFVPIFEELKRAGYGLTIHAGESVSEEILMDSVIKSNPARVGHATSLSSLKSVEYFKKNSIHVEACPSSNEILNNIADRKDHPLFCFQNFRGSINTDDRSFFAKSLCEEVRFLLEKEIITISEFARFQINAAEDAFCKENSSLACLNKVLSYWTPLSDKSYALINTPKT